MNTYFGNTYFSDILYFVLEVLYALDHVRLGRSPKIFQLSLYAFWNRSCSKLELCNGLSSKKEFDQVKPIHLQDLSQKDGFLKVHSD